MPSTIRKLRVFLCHASQDKTVVRELREKLKDEGWVDPWLDEKKIRPGEDWRVSIEEAVEAADLVVICLSKNSVNKEGFVQKEMRYAREIALEKPEGTIFLIPLRLEECDVPRGLRFFQWTDYFGKQKEKNYNDLLESFSIRRQEVIRRESEEKARREAEERTEKEKEEKIRKEAEERATRDAEVLARKLAEEKTRKEAEDRAHKDTLEKIRKEAYEKAVRETEEKARFEMEAQKQRIGEETSQKGLPLSLIITLVLSCVTMLAISLVLLSSPAIATWFKENFQLSGANPPISPLATSTNVEQPSASNSFLTLQLEATLQSDGTLAPRKVASDNLQLTPGSHVLNGIPINFQYEINTQNEGTPNYPETLTVPCNIQNPLAVYFLVQADWGYSRYADLTIGKIVTKFSNGSFYEYPLIMGVNMRDWKRGDAPEAVTTVSSPDIIYPWTGVSPDGYSGGMDLLKISIPAEYQSLTITSIDIVDVTYQTMSDYDPGIRILAGTIEVRDTP